MGVVVELGVVVVVGVAVVGALLLEVPNGVGDVGEVAVGRFGVSVRRSVYGSGYVRRSEHRRFRVEGPPVSMPKPQRCIRIEQYVGAYVCGGWSLVVARRGSAFGLLRTAGPVTGNQSQGNIRYLTCMKMVLRHGGKMEEGWNY